MSKFDPRPTVPEPDNVVIMAPWIVDCEISKVPLSSTGVELAIEPAPLSTSSVPASMVVSPV